MIVLSNFDFDFYLKKYFKYFFKKKKKKVSIII